MGKNILIVEDDREFRKLLSVVLQNEGYEVHAVESSGEAWDAAIGLNPDLILTDVSLGGLSGIELCNKIKKDNKLGETPVILISGTRMEEEDQLMGLELGADDYLLKPVSNELLLAKVKAVLRRYATAVDAMEVIEAQGLKMDLKARVVEAYNLKISLTRKEFELLATLLRKRGQVLYLSHLFHSIWGYDANLGIDSHTVKVHISSLRKKLGATLGEKIVSVPGLGYKFED